MPKLLVSAPVNWQRVLPLVYIYRGDAVLHVCSSQLAVNQLAATVDQLTTLKLLVSAPVNWRRVLPWCTVHLPWRRHTSCLLQSIGGEVMSQLVFKLSLGSHQPQ
ncbi:11469_t:CDS:2, partial [Dentiscutata heterogama]